MFALCSRWFRGDDSATVSARQISATIFPSVEFGNSPFSLDVRKNNAQSRKRFFLTAFSPPWTIRMGFRTAPPFGRDGI
jgi:hypothetical protein